MPLENVIMELFEGGFLAPSLNQQFARDSRCRLTGNNCLGRVHKECRKVLILLQQLIRVRRNTEKYVLTQEKSHDEQSECSVLEAVKILSVFLEPDLCSVF